MGGTMGGYTRLALAATLGLAVTTPALATEDGQIWTNENVTVKLSANWRLSEDITQRFSDHKHGLYEMEANTLLGYKLNKWVTVWAGYTHDPQYAAGKFTIMEHRAREQVTFDKIARVGPGILSARLRTEQRWRTNADGTGWRVRPFVRYTIPLPNAGAPELPSRANPSST